MADPCRLLLQWYGTLDGNQPEPIGESKSHVVESMANIVTRAANASVARHGVRRRMSSFDGSLHSSAVPIACVLLASCSRTELGNANATMTPSCHHPRHSVCKSMPKPPPQLEFPS